MSWWNRQQFRRSQQVVKSVGNTGTLGGRGSLPDPVDSLQNKGAGLGGREGRRVTRMLSLAASYSAPMTAGICRYVTPRCLTWPRSRRTSRPTLVAGLDKIYVNTPGQWHKEISPTLAAVCLFVWIISTSLFSPTLMWMARDLLHALLHRHNNSWTAFFEPVVGTGSKKAVHVLLCLCNNACKRSLAICRKSRALCPVSRPLSIPIWPACVKQGR